MNCFKWKIKIQNSLSLFFVFNFGGKSNVMIIPLKNHQYVCEYTCEMSRIITCIVTPIVFKQKQIKYLNSVNTSVHKRN